MRFQREKKRLETSLIPFINVIFLLVVFFLVSDTHKPNDYATEVTPPKADTGGKINLVQLSLTLTDDNMVMMDDVPIKLDNLERDIALRVDSREYQGRPVVIHADAVAEATILVRMINAASRAGITDISIITQSRQ